MMPPPFHSNNTNFAYQIRFHIGFATHCRRSHFGLPTDRELVEQLFHEVCAQGNYHSLEFEAESDSVRTLISLTPEHVPSQVVQTLKANMSRRWNLKRADRLRWSRGYFFRSVGDVTGETVAAYVASQREHHSERVRLLAEYSDPDGASLLEERFYAHCVGQFAVHVVFCPVRHVPALDRVTAARTLAQVQLIADKRGFQLVRVAVLEDHIHAVIVLPPTMSPAFVAFALMNNTSYWFSRNNPGLFKVWDVPGVWNPSAYIGTIGDVTSQHVRNSIRQVRD
jgi:putative transposase